MYGCDLAGVWRRKAIETAGGWNSRTTVEDMDLSLRAHLAGWKAVYLRHVSVLNEVSVLPPYQPSCGLPCCCMQEGSLTSICIKEPATVLEDCRWKLCAAASLGAAAHHSSARAAPAALCSYLLAGSSDCLHCAC